MPKFEINKRYRYNDTEFTVLFVGEQNVVARCESTSGFRAPGDELTFHLNSPLSKGSVPAPTAVEAWHFYVAPRDVEPFLISRPPRAEAEAAFASYRRQPSTETMSDIMWVRHEMKPVERS